MYSRGNTPPFRLAATQRKVRDPESAQSTTPDAVGPSWIHSIGRHRLRTHSPGKRRRHAPGAFAGPAHRGPARDTESTGGVRQQRHGQGQRIALHAGGFPATSCRGSCRCWPRPNQPSPRTRARGRCRCATTPGSATEPPLTPPTSWQATRPSWIRRAPLRSSARSPTSRTSRRWMRTPSNSRCANPRSPSRRPCSSASPRPKPSCPANAWRTRH